MATLPPKPKKPQPDQFPPDERNELLHTDKSHKDWYNPGQMGNLGDKRGFLPKERRKKPKYQDKSG